MPRIKFIEVKNKFKFPKTSGVYFLCDKNKKPLYIGKAISLKDRLETHFKNPSFLLQKEIQNIKKIGYIKTGSEIEAILLESKMIKKYRPKSNVMLKDDKQYFYVGITKENLPKVFITHQIKKRLQLTGYRQQFKKQPAVDRKLPAKFIGPFTEGKSLKTVLKLLRRVFPYYTKTHGKLPCFYCHLGFCPGPNPNPETYQNNIKKLIAVLEGKRQSVLKNLEKEMLFSAKSQNFEAAARIRDKIQAFLNIFQHRDVNNIDFMNQTNNALPISRILQTIKNLLGLKNLPLRIDACDISNIQGKFAVGSIVTFINGATDKNSYRRFKMRILEKSTHNTFGAADAGRSDDTAMIKETLERRFKHLEWQYPDLMLIDGGIGQLNAALSLKPKPKNIKFIALAKKENKLYVDKRKNPILLKNLPQEISNFILRVRDEAHRFAINYYRKLHRKSLNE